MEEDFKNTTLSNKTPSDQPELLQQLHNWIVQYSELCHLYVEEKNPEAQNRLKDLLKANENIGLTLLEKTSINRSTASSKRHLLIPLSGSGKGNLNRFSIHEGNCLSYKTDITNIANKSSSLILPSRTYLKSKKTN